MFDQTSWIWLACKVGISVPKSSPTSSYLTPRHFMAASIMSGSCPTILDGSFGSRYITGGSVGSRPTLSVLPARPGYFVATFSGSHAACAGLPTKTASTTTATAQIAMPRIRLISSPSSLSLRALPSSVSRRCRRCGGRVLAPRQPSPRQEPAAPCPARQLALARDDLAPRHRQHGDRAELETVKGIISRSGVQPSLIHHGAPPRVEQDEIRITPDGDRALARVEPEDARRVRRECADERVNGDAPLGDPFGVDDAHFGLEP